MVKLLRLCKNRVDRILLLILLLQSLAMIWYFNKKAGKGSSTTGLNKSPEHERVEVFINAAEKISLKYYIPMKKYNNLRITNPQNCSREGTKFNSTKKFFVITNFIYLKHKNYAGNLAGFPINDKTLEARIMEIIKCLQSNLNHPFVEQVHVLVKEREAIEYLRRLPLENSKKLVIHVPEGLVSMKTQLEYAGECLMGKIVAIAHQDNQFGKGWEKLKPEILKNKRIVYALTRHTPEHLPCQGSKGSANCDPGYPYLGSHDVFMFHVKEKFNSHLLKEIKDVTPNLYGMENLFIWVFDKKLKYTVLNPCVILVVHHHHCIPIRDGGRRRVNKQETTGYAEFTDQLEPSIARSTIKPKPKTTPSSSSHSILKYIKKIFFH